MSYKMNDSNKFIIIFKYLYIKVMLAFKVEFLNQY